MVPVVRDDERQMIVVQFRLIGERVEAEGNFLNAFYAGLGKILSKSIERCRYYTHRHAYTLTDCTRL